MFRSALIILSIIYLHSLAYAQVDLERGLIGCYPFSGNAKDYSPIANHGTVSGAKLAEDRFGNANSAYEFDGFDDWIEISPDDLQLDTFSYSLWVNPNAAPAYTTAMFLFSVGSDYGDQHVLFGDHYSNDRHTGFSHGCYQGVADNILCSGPSVEPIRQWYHLALVKDANDYTFYVNGQMVCSNSANGKKPFYGTSTIRAMIGARNNYGQASSGRIDDIHLYDRPLTKDEIDALYKGPNMPSVPVTGELTVSKTQICAGESVSLKVVSSKPGSVFNWEVDNVAQSESSSALSLKTEARTSDYQIKIRVNVSFDPTCFTQPPPFEVDKTLEIKSCANPPEETSGLWVPDIFTPNRDGKNDTWKIYNAAGTEGLRIFIFNRWGEVIYYSQGYTKEWDGRYRDELVPSGSYPFRILSGEKLIKQGSLMVVY
ncbi:LamG-like jellyroll fold domain-containing protein [Dyadobacter soli]|uniref:LamG-like jellyroll fold domain-containing protein n=1 Tax=Dyadobacter soli TaxID=659014 RepID=UPI000A75D302|nr:LamG-like jellyroll fold domain-containing protein [Dyadobacter soli]